MHQKIFNAGTGKTKGTPTDRNRSILLTRVGFAQWLELTHHPCLPYRTPTSSPDLNSPLTSRNISSCRRTPALLNDIIHDATVSDLGEAKRWLHDAFVPDSLIANIFPILPWIAEYPPSEKLTSKRRLWFCLLWHFKTLPSTTNHLCLKPSLSL